MAVYLLHFDKPVGHSRHYLGTAEPKNLYARIMRHKNGTGGRLPREAVARGCVISVALVWPVGGRDFERYLKKHRNASKWCPLCGRNSRTIPTTEMMMNPRGEAFPRGNRNGRMR